MRPMLRLCLTVVPVLLLVSWCLARPADQGEPLTRLFFQNHKTSMLKWADVRLSDGKMPILGPLQDVAGFKKLDAAKQKLVQMKEQNGLILVGVRDEDNGNYESGWILVHTGVGYVDHGDHGHWRYKKLPEVWDSRLDDKQGNPAHLYLYDGCFYLANDLLNGYTRIDPAKYATSTGRKLGKDTPRFLKGGGNHITLAVVEDKVGYSCWIDGGGPNKGRVDVTAIHGKGEPAYSFQLPSGVIHGAIANSGKVFFAPAESVCWVEADLTLTGKPETVKIHHIDLGKDGDKARRTGAFTNHGKYVLFTTGRDEGSMLVLVDAKAAEPKPISVPLAVKKGQRALTPEVAALPDGRVYAFVFLNPPSADVEVDDELIVLELDPNKDGNYSDAKPIKMMKIGKSAVSGHYGHHDIAFDADRRFAFFTNPGDGTITALSLKTLEPVATFKVGGMPTALLARGGLEDHD